MSHNYLIEMLPHKCGKCGFVSWFCPPLYTEGQVKEFICIECNTKYIKQEENNNDCTQESVADEEAPREIHTGESDRPEECHSEGDSGESV